MAIRTRICVYVKSKLIERVFGIGRGWVVCCVSMLEEMLPMPASQNAIADAAAAGEGITQAVISRDYNSLRLSI